MNIPTKLTFNLASNFWEEDRNAKSLRTIRTTDTKWWQ